MTFQVFKIVLKYGISCVFLLKMIQGLNFISMIIYKCISFYKKSEWLSLFSFHVHPSLFCMNLIQHALQLKHSKLYGPTFKCLTC